jgi:hypothetical protein
VRRNIFGTLSTLFLLTNLALLVTAHAHTSPQTSTVDQDNTEKIIRIGGYESIVQEITMGPSATDFWRRLQKLVLHRELLEDFSNIAQLFQLTVHDEASVPASPAGVFERTQIADERFRAMNEISYSASRDSHDRKLMHYQFKFDTNLIHFCATASEFRRFFGKGQIFPMNQFYPASVQSDPTGTPFGEGYITAVDQVDTEILLLEYFASGCLSRVTFIHTTVELAGAPK